MRCRQVRSKLADFVEGDLNPKAAEELALHLEHCSLCRGEREALGRALKRLSSYHEEAEVQLRPPDLPHGLAEAMQSPPGRAWQLGTPAYRGHWGPSVAVAACALVAIVVAGRGLDPGPGSPGLSPERRQMARALPPPGGPVDVPQKAVAAPPAASSRDESKTVKTSLSGPEPGARLARVPRHARQVARALGHNRSRATLRRARGFSPRSRARVSPARGTLDQTAVSATKPRPPVTPEPATQIASAAGAGPWAVAGALQSVAEVARGLSKSAARGTIEGLALAAGPMESAANAQMIDARDQARRTLDQLQLAAAAQARASSSGDTKL
ncbi:MAG TPA: zf-HC2 domain-containing protein [Armatimonadota bacterium]